MVAIWQGVGAAEEGEGSEQRGLAATEQPRQAGEVQPGNAVSCVVISMQVPGGQQACPRDHFTSSIIV